MAERHQLFLEIPETNNTKVFRISDTSIYSEAIEVKCPTLQIKSPGYTLPVSIEVLKGFNLVLNACTLGIATSGCSDDAPSLPDGIYHIKYSVSPNDKVYAEYYHLRTTQTINVYSNALASLELSPCEPGEVIKHKLNELRLIKSFIDAAKIYVEDKHYLEEGMNLIQYAKKLLTKYTQTC